ncbi:DUF3515 family protein [Homoserinibacter sp. YIM 151385]|uniref:DUF3515 family protein n=1 Tax=Homoserinibacter sp. YIM 151385 TaxID=2985506 RepID=UPI0022F0D377|nr:DUF3515 family protein [Homoserinibacter sp. YIM 151385]WBU39219.1 DUF3515 family protein [Homoserinibacter sp. YIM 151385]
MPARHRSALAIVALLGAGIALSGCSAIVPLEPAAGSNDPLCAAVTVRLKDTTDIQGLERRETNAQATTAWGDPVSVVVRCGVEAPEVSELPCIEIDGIFWLRDDRDAPNLVFRSFGREPAVDVAVDNDVVSSGIVLGSLSNAIGQTEGNGRRCTSLDDTVTGEDGPADD